MQRAAHPGGAAVCFMTLELYNCYVHTAFQMLFIVTKLDALRVNAKAVITTKRWLFRFRLPVLLGIELRG